MTMPESQAVTAAEDMIPLTTLEQSVESGCHNSSEQYEAAQAAGKSETLEQYAKDYPQGPHDQPQSMCPAFG